MAEGGAGVDGGADGGGGGEAQLPAVLWRCCPHLPAQKEMSLVLCPPFVQKRHQSAAIDIARFHCTLREAHDAAHLQMFVVLLLIQE